MVLLCQGNGQGDFVEIVVGLANEGEQESTPWLRFSPLGGSARHFCALDRARKCEANRCHIQSSRGKHSSPLLVLSTREKAELFHGGSSNERLRSQSLAGNVSRSTARGAHHSTLTGKEASLSGSPLQSEIGIKVEKLLESTTLLDLTAEVAVCLCRLLPAIHLRDTRLL